MKSLANLMDAIVKHSDVDFRVKVRALELFNFFNRKYRNGRN